MGKRIVSVTINDDIHKQAKDKGFNISEAAEDGILKRLNRTELATEEYPKELAELEPNVYWIDSKDNKCKKRPQEQYFINENGNVHAVGKAEYMLKLRHHARDRVEVKEKLKKDKKPELFINDYEETTKHGT